jgi:hypothetical protein
MIKHFLREFSYVFWTSEVVIPSFDAGTFFVLPEGVSNDTFMTATCPTADLSFLDLTVFICVKRKSTF